MDKASEFLDAASQGERSKVEALLREDPGFVHIRGDFEKTALHLAAERNDLALAELLVAAEAELDARATWGHTPLEWSAICGSEEVADFLIEAGAAGMQLWVAAGLGMLDRVKSYWNDASSLRTDTGYTISFVEVDRAAVEADPQADYVEIVSDAFYMAGRNGHIDIAEWLLERGAEIDSRGYFGGTALHWAAYNGHQDAVAFLVENGADLELHDDQFEATPCGWAEESGNDAIVRYLVSKGAP